MTQCDFSLLKSTVTRFSHDLAGVVSAVSNSLSLLEELGGGDQETLDLATDNANTLMGRLRFFRAAFGNEGPLTDLNVTRTIFDDYLKTLENKVIRYESFWQVEPTLPIFVFRLILLGGMVAAETLPRGGRISFQTLTDNRQIQIKAEGKTVGVDPKTQAALDGDNEDSTQPKSVPVLFLKTCLAEHGWHISLSCQNETVIIELSDKK